MSINFRIELDDAHIPLKWQNELVEELGMCCLEDMGVMTVGFWMRDLPGVPYEVARDLQLVALRHHAPDLLNLRPRHNKSISYYDAMAGLYDNDVTSAQDLAQLSHEELLSVFLDGYYK
jgi:hypothetical protein